MISESYRWGTHSSVVISVTAESIFALAESIEDEWWELLAQEQENRIHKAQEQKMKAKSEVTSKYPAGSRDTSRKHAQRETRGRKIIQDYENQESWEQRRKQHVREREQGRHQERAQRQYERDTPADAPWPEDNPELLPVEQARLRRLVETHTAQAIPEELFERILGHMCTRAEEEGTLEYDKVVLCNCALVSRYWAAKCQAQIFRSVRLCCAADVRELLAMVVHPGSKLARYIEALRLEVPREAASTAVGSGIDISKPFTPWFHLVPLLSIKLPSCRCELSLQDNAQWPKPTRALRTIHWNLPRTLPAQSRGLRKLVLHGLVLASFGDLYHLLDGLHDLCELHCSDLRWLTASPLTTLHASKPRSSLLTSVEIELFRYADAHTLWLLFVYRAPAQTRLTHTNDGLATLALLLTTMTPDSARSPHLRAVRTLHNTRKHIYYS